MGGDTALLAVEGARLVSPRWPALIEDACRCMGSPYPLDVDAREHILDRLEMEQPDLLDGLDERLYPLELDEPVDETIDNFIGAHKSSFFV